MAYLFSVLFTKRSLQSIYRNMDSSKFYFLFVPSSSASIRIFFFGHSQVNLTLPTEEGEIYQKGLRSSQNWGVLLIWPETGRKQDGCGEPENRNLASVLKQGSRQTAAAASLWSWYLSSCFPPQDRQPACSSPSHVLTPWLHGGRRGRGRPNRVCVSHVGKRACDLLSNIDDT